MEQNNARRSGPGTQREFSQRAALAHGHVRADPTRRIILDELTDRNGQTLFEICSRLTTKHHLGSSRQAISQHLDVLETVGLVETRREGRYKFHYINTGPLEPIIERWLKQPDKDGGGPDSGAPTQTGRQPT